MSIYELIEKIQSDLNQTAQAILIANQNLKVLRDALKTAEAAMTKEEKKEDGDA